MRYENKKMNRDGLIFKTGRDTFDLSSLRYLHVGVDTVKQLYNCAIHDSVIAKINAYTEVGGAPVLNVGGVDWLFSKSGKTSGYQYIFKNIDFGFVVLLKSFYKDANEIGSHLKIEVTPQLIDQCTPSGLDIAIDNVASMFAGSLSRSGIACHICVDMKGLSVPEDFEKRLITHSRRNYRVNNISNAEFNINESAVIYGNSQTYTFGNINSLQLCLYDKTAQAKKIDKLQFWEQIWKQTASVDDFLESEYQPGDVVHRLEFRFHHTVINEFVNGTFFPDSENRITISNFSELSLHLTALWGYALNNFRLQHSSVYIDPLWQALSEDIKFFAPAPGLMYKRAKKAPSDSSRRNIAYTLGNILKVFARKSFKPDFVTDFLLSSGLNDDLADYFCLPFADRDLLRVALHDFVSEKLQIHLLNGVAA